MPDEDRGKGVWWVIHSIDLRTALERCYLGEDPGIIMAELYANTEEQEEAGDEYEDE